MTSKLAYAATVHLNAVGVICAAANDLPSLRTAIFADAARGVAVNDRVWSGHALPLGCVDGALADIGELPASLRSRNNAMLLSALAQIRDVVDGAIARYGAHRVGICLGTSTSGIAEAEIGLSAHARDGAFPAGFHISQQELGSPAIALAHVLGAAGPVSVVSTACSSSAKAMISAARWLRMGLCDVVISGGVDTLCAFTVAGFAALEAVSTTRCNPFSANRNGINIGEGAALFVMSRDSGPIQLLGWGEASDAHHVSAPEPSGRGARMAMQAALNRAGLAADDIDYINLHGTATAQNDVMEAIAVAAVLGERIAASSTKPLTGHTLGAAAAIEAAICWAALTDNPQGRFPVHHWDGVADPALPALQIATAGSQRGRPLRRVLSNSFAFGGSNTSLIFGAA